MLVLLIFAKSIYKIFISRTEVKSTGVLKWIYIANIAKQRENGKVFFFENFRVLEDGERNVFLR